jgi:hypothetical protein
MELLLHQDGLLRPQWLTFPCDFSIFTAYGCSVARERTLIMCPNEPVPIFSTNSYSFSIYSYTLSIN